MLSRKLAQSSIITLGVVFRDWLWQGGVVRLPAYLVPCSHRNLFVLRSFLAADLRCQPGRPRALSWFLVFNSNVVHNEDFRT